MCDDTFYLTIFDKDTIEQEWVMFQHGKPVDSRTFRLQWVEQL